MKFDASVVCTVFPSPLGPLTLAASAQGLAGLWFEDQRYLPAQILPRMNGSPAPWPVATGNPLLERTCEQLAQYFAGRRTAFDVPLDVSGGTPFQQAVWLLLRAIDPGQTRTYGQVAQQLGKPAAVRAVGAAVGRNPVSIIIPCHRVLGTGGALTGYAGGLTRKAALLNLEGAPAG